jgi:hypothetical protein
VVARRPGSIDDLTGGGMGAATDAGVSGLAARRAGDAISEAGPPLGGQSAPGEPT